MKKIFFLACMICSAPALFAQDSVKINPLTISGYAEIYYQTDNNHSINNERPSFIYSFNRKNEVALNLGFIKASYNTQQIRANLALAAGTYMNSNYAMENGGFKNVYEANAGIKISKNANLWLDAGIFSSHIGFESAVGKDCWNLTRSMLSDNSPFYETGVKIGYTTKDEKWYLSALILNGWQRIQRVSGNTTPAFGTQITYKPSSSITLNSSSFIGNDKPDSTRQMRYFHNFYGIFQLNSRWVSTIGFDIGAEQIAKGVSSYNVWYSPVFMLKCMASTKASIAARAEYYSDKNGVMIATGTPNGFQTWGFSANFDYAISSNAVWRIEAKNLSSKDQVFYKGNTEMMNQSLSFITSLAISF
jgi:hypothetical protein